MHRYSESINIKKKNSYVLLLSTPENITIVHKIAIPRQDNTVRRKNNGRHSRHIRRINKSIQVLGLKKEVYNVSLSTVRSFLLPLEATMQVFRSGQATAACLHWQEDISKTERPNPGNWSRNGSPGLIIPDSFSGNKQGWTGRELNRILFCPACQRNSLASVPQPLVIITLASPHRNGPPDELADSGQTYLSHQCQALIARLAARDKRPYQNQICAWPWIGRIDGRDRLL
ncbi:hypothetical protein P885DRAFT_62714 [Corynascus similis CBS 632.67]